IRDQPLDPPALDLVGRPRPLISGSSRARARARAQEGLTAESSPITHPIAAAAKGAAGIGQRLACYSLRVVAGDLNTIVVQAGKSVNRRRGPLEVPKEPELPLRTDAPLLQVRDL